MFGSRRQTPTLANCYACGPTDLGQEETTSDVRIPSVSQCPSERLDTAYSKRENDLTGELGTAGGERREGLIIPFIRV